MGDSRRRFLFVLGSARREGNAELLARHAAESLPHASAQAWLRLSELSLVPFEDIRHEAPGIYPPPTGDMATLLTATLDCTDLVFVTPLYWYSLPGAAKLYLDHWSGWLRVPGANFRERMAGKTLWLISSYSGDDRADAAPLLGTLCLTADYMKMRWGGSILASGNRPGDVLQDGKMLQAASRLFSERAAPEESPAEAAG